MKMNFVLKTIRELLKDLRENTTIIQHYIGALQWEKRWPNVSALDSGSNGPGSSPGRGTALCSWARHFTPIVTLFTKVYKWVPANLLLRVALRWTSIPSRGE